LGYFTISEDENFVKCVTCKISCGGENARTYGTTNLAVDLKGKHPISC